jgi:hypothetical protein
MCNNFDLASEMPFQLSGCDRALNVKPTGTRANDFMRLAASLNRDSQQFSLRAGNLVSIEQSVPGSVL